jgi:hypothetical protein
MKKSLLLLGAISLFSIAQAQVGTAPVMGFEAWHAIAPPTISSEDPNGWASLNALTITGTALSVSKETSAPAAGSITAKVTTVKIQGATIPSPYGGNLDTAGILAIGSVVVGFPPTINYGFSYTSRSAMLSFKSKSAPMPGDSCFVLAYLTKWNTALSHRDTIATGKYATGATTTSYATNSLNMVYKPGFANVFPDTQQVFISSSVYSHDGAKIGSSFWIDELAWSGWVSTNDIDGIVNNVSLYPNPADNYVALECTVDSKFVEVTDITGRQVGTYEMNSNKTRINTAEFSKGLYIYQVVDKNNKVLNRGKFEVAH